MPENDKIKIFISYSHKDKEHHQELCKHLKPLKKAKLIDSWEDGELLPGDNWDDVIKRNLEASDIVLFLLSIDFLDSNYIDKNEIQIAVEKHHKGELVIVPILIRKCYIKGTIFEKLQGLPSGLVPILSKDWHIQDDAYVDIVEGLERIILDLKGRKEKNKEIKEREKRDKEERERIEKEKKELERKELERKELERKEIERKEIERKEIERKELERKELERKEKLEKEKKEQDVLVRNELSKATKFYNEKNYNDAFSIYFKYKNHKLFNGTYQCIFGGMYYLGHGVEQDYIEAVKWYQKSADQGNHYGQYNLAKKYEDGYGVTKDITKAKELYQKSAKQGYDLAQSACKRLGITY